MLRRLLRHHDKGLAQLRSFDNAKPPNTLKAGSKLDILNSPTYPDSPVERVALDPLVVVAATPHTEPLPGTYLISMLQPVVN